MMPAFKSGTPPSIQIPADLLVVGVFKGNVLSAPAREVDEALPGVLGRHLESARTLGGSVDAFQGKAGQVTVIPTMGRLPASAVMVVGLGEQDKLDHEQVRKAAGVAARAGGGFDSVVLDLSAGVEGGAQAAAEGFGLGSYSFSRYRKDKLQQSAEAVVVGAGSRDLERAAILTDATRWARDLVNEPPSSRGPEIVAEMARERAEAAGLEVQILDEPALEATGMNGILTVGKGSDSPPCMILITYEPEGSAGFVGLVGKGITFDSGGLSIKTGEGMENMKKDCSGGAAVIAAITALPALRPKIKVVAAVALAENMPGPRAVKPGDIIAHYGGRTSEVLNTDAEGRLVLADALAWAAEQGPDAIVDIATLTGAMVVALGTRVAGMFSSTPELGEQLVAASRRTGEPVWEMPLVEEYRSALASPVADSKNISGSRHAGSIMAALFLKDFVGGTPWAHLDIAGPAWNDKPDHYLSAGATGYGTRLLIDWVESRIG